MVKRLATILAAAAAFVAPHTASAQSAGDNVPQINSIIQSLAPAARTRYSEPRYRAKIRTVEVPVTINVNVQPTGPSRTTQRSYTLNYNHSRDFRVHFAFDKAVLTNRAKDVLDVLGQALISPALANTTYLIGGHTDTVGPAEYNWFLSERRALAVKEYLVTTFNIDPARLEAVGFGETLLAVDRTGAVAANRRVEVTLVETEAATVPAPVAEAPSAPTPAPVAEAPQTAALPAPPRGTGNIVCDTTPVRLTDPRPARNSLDDYGGRRTPVACGEVHAAPPPSNIDAINDALN
ncbi:MAG: OmpA family protein [Pseudomonadota bacterium]